MWRIIFLLTSGFFRELRQVSNRDVALEPRMRIFNATVAPNEKNTELLRNFGGKRF